MLHACRFFVSPRTIVSVTLCTSLAVFDCFATSAVSFKTEFRPMVRSVWELQYAGFFLQYFLFSPPDPLSSPLFPVPD